MAQDSEVLSRDQVFDSLIAALPGAVELVCTANELQPVNGVLCVLHLTTRVKHVHPFGELDSESNEAVILTRRAERVARLAGLSAVAAEEDGQRELPTSSAVVPAVKPIFVVTYVSKGSDPYNQAVAALCALVAGFADHARLVELGAKVHNPFLMKALTSV